MQQLFKRIVAPMIVWGTLAGCSSDEVTGPCTPADTRQFTAPWSQLSDAQLHTEIVRACGRVFVGFKESGTARGVGPQGQNLTSDETVSRMKQFLLDRRVVLEWESTDLPHVSARMPLSREVVEELRHHSNTDYLEPIFPGVYLGRQ